MGCIPSKDAAASSDRDAPSSKPSIIPQVASQAVSDALQTFHGRTSVVDQMLLAKQYVTTTTQTKARQLQNIFATPLDGVDANYIAPSYPKTPKEHAFIETAILQNFVFSTLQKSELETMIAAFEKISFPAQTAIIQQGDTGDFFYVVEKGTVVFDVSGKTVGDGTGGPGSTFGELALLYNAPRAATVTTSSKVIAYRVDQTTFRTILQNQTQVADKTKYDLLQNVSFLQELDDVDLGKLASNLTPRVFTKGDVLVSKGDDGDAFYVIQEGTVLVTDISVGGQTYEDMALGAGDFFGERALVTKEPRTANCIAATNGIALSVDSDTFQKVMGAMSQLILKASDKRRLEGIKIFQHTTLDPSDLSSLAELILDFPLKKGHVLFTEGGDDTQSALYMVREGKIKLTCTQQAIYATEYNDKVIAPGGFFGDDMLERDAKERSKTNSVVAMSTPLYTATVMEDCVVGILTLDECRTVFDTKTVGKAKKTTSSSLNMSIKDADIDLPSLKRHAILGAGTFGQVWLVSRPTTNGESGARKPYALKIQSKYELVRHSQARGVVQEKNIMAQLQHPFIINLVTTYQDKQRVFMLLGIVQGGELFSLMHKASFDGIPETSAKFYAAGIFEGLGYMHRRHILYRDLKPENVLIDETGYPCIVDLGFAKYVKEKTYTLCGTPLYIAPEVVLNRGHDKGADHWSLGVMIFEMISGYTPFYKDGMDQISLFRAIVKGNFKYPRTRKSLFSEKSKDLINRMLVIDPTQRLGSLARGEKDIYRSAWFEEINFDKLKRKEIPAPWIPKIKDPLDTSNFENWDHLDNKEKAKDPPISRKDDDIFKTF
eukprot:CAMPEP_0119013792 /NCGR_PEP_ID=MMETSP1176-20130426/8976_1 /TAXON_ID=265551 /ORGANISM="Synedropsis recta cf, Strain CCMP1620" /LENGTH=829 /DNA_ID=CAMNT_0006966911 /DNA_START=183 /DNA_END=2672 /DNA_ORIENTATION=+